MPHLERVVEDIVDKDARTGHIAGRIVLTWSLYVCQRTEQKIRRLTSTLSNAMAEPCYASSERKGNLERNEPT